MNKFPCKNCLVRVNCSEYCKELELNNKVIDIYVVSLKQCPDCGSKVNIGSAYNKTTIVCFDCSKAFQQTVSPKIDIKIIKFNITAHVSKNNPTNIITDLDDFVDSPSLTMEETHDIFYERLTKNESLYIIKKIKDELKTEISKPLFNPKNETNYQIGRIYNPINPDPNIGKQPTHSIIY